MARKWLSGVLAFAMVFGCAAPVALADAPVAEVVEQESIEVEEQNSVFSPKVDKSTYAYRIEDGAVEEVVMIKKAPDADHATATIKVDGVSGTDGKVKTDEGFKAELVSNEIVKFSFPKNMKVPDGYHTYKIEVTYKPADDTTDKYVNKSVEFNVVVGTNSQYEPIDKNNITKGFGELIVGQDWRKVLVQYTDKGQGADPINPSDMKVELSIGMDEYVDYKIEKKDDGKMYLCMRAKKCMPQDKKGGFILTVITKDGKGSFTIGDAKNYNKITTLNAVIEDGDTSYDVVSIEFVKEASKIECKSHDTIAVQAKRHGDFASQGLIDYDNAAMHWYVNGKLLTEDNEAGVGRYEVTVGTEPFTGVYFTKNYSDSGSINAIRNVLAGLPGTYEIKVVSVKNPDVYATTTITVPKVAADKAVKPANTVLKGANVLKGSEFNVADFAKTQVSTTKAGTKSQTITEDYGKEKYIDSSNLKWAVSVEKAENGKDEALTSEQKKLLDKNISIANGILTVKSDLPTQPKMPNLIRNISVTVGEGETAVTYQGINIINDVETIKKIELKQGDKFLEHGDTIVLVAGHSTKLDATLYSKYIKRYDEKNVPAINQDMFWQIENTRPGDEKTYATVKNGMITAIAETPSSDSCAVTVRGASDPSESVSVRLVIVPDPAATPTPTATPTAAPAEIKGRINTKSSPLNIREKATTSSTKVARADKGSIVTILGEEGKFYRVRLADGTEGYASKDYVVIVGDTPVVTPTAKPTEKPVTGNTAVTKAKLKLRKAPINGKVITIMKKDAVVKVVAPGAEWSKVEYDGNVGYASNAYLEFVVG